MISGLAHVVADIPFIAAHSSYDRSAGLADSQGFKGVVLFS
jgi:hypothetical protein